MEFPHDAKRAGVERFGQLPCRVFVKHKLHLPGIGVVVESECQEHMTFTRRTGGLDRDFAQVQKVEQSTGVLARLHFIRHDFDIASAQGGDATTKRSSTDGPLFGVQ